MWHRQLVDNLQGSHWWVYLYIVYFVLTWTVFVELFWWFSHNLVNNIQTKPNSFQFRFSLFIKLLYNETASNILCSSDALRRCSMYRLYVDKSDALRRCSMYRLYVCEQDALRRFSMIRLFFREIWHCSCIGYMFAKLTFCHGTYIKVTGWSQLDIATVLHV